MNPNRPYPPILMPPAKEIPQTPNGTANQFPLNEALQRGTLFKWLYDPYYK